MDIRRNTALFFAAYFLEGLCFYAPVATLYRRWPSRSATLPQGSSSRSMRATDTDSMAPIWARVSPAAWR